MVHQSLWILFLLACCANNSNKRTLRCRREAVRKKEVLYIAYVFLIFPKAKYYIHESIFHEDQVSMLFMAIYSRDMRVIPLTHSLTH